MQGSERFSRNHPRKFVCSFSSDELSACGTRSLVCASSTYANDRARANEEFPFFFVGRAGADTDESMLALPTTGT